MTCNIFGLLYFTCQIDPKPAIPRDEQDKTEKIFVGGISAEVNEDEFREFFSQFGTVIDATLMTERETGRPRGFGFITFETSQGVEEALRQSKLTIKDKTASILFIGYCNK
jgi:RNA recognition motif-containing protein